MASEPSRDAGELGRPRWGHAHAGAPRASRRRRRRRRDRSRIPQRLPGDVRRRRRQGVLHQARDPRRVRPLLHAVHGAGQGRARGGTRALVQLRVHRATARDGRRETRHGQTGSRVQQRRGSERADAQGDGGHQAPATAGAHSRHEGAAHAEDAQSRGRG